jgi:hypothetical protein
LDDRVIQHLSEENRRLKEELDIVKDGKEIGAAEGKKQIKANKEINQAMMFFAFYTFTKKCFMSK